MKVSISWPPLESDKGVPLLSQNRQFQWFHNPTYIYPVVPAYAATLLKTKGHDVTWDDGIAEGLAYSEWKERLRRIKPDLIALETKTPVVKKHWEIIKDLKRLDFPCRIVLYGDHVTAFPTESFENSPVDYVITGGDYDFLLADLASFLDVRRKDHEGDFSIDLEGSGQMFPPGIYYRDAEGKPHSNGAALLKHNLDDLPYIDRDLTKWELYAYKNGNFKYTPGTYVMAGRDCWWGRCSFCSWTTLYPGQTYRTISPQRHADEIGQLIERGVKEIFDDSGCFPNGEWLDQFCDILIERGYQKKAVFGCNMRVAGLKPYQYKRLKDAGFRFFLLGIESVNQETLDRIDKNVKVEKIYETVKLAKDAGLEPHITTMVGYPWESREDAFKTIRFTKELFKKGTIDSLQATIVVPYPGTPLFNEAKTNGWLLTENWDDYDMSTSVWKSPVTAETVRELTADLYRQALNPVFIFRKLTRVRSFADLGFLLRAGLKLFGHLLDFKKR